MTFYKLINGNYIDAVGTGNGGKEITETEFNEILSAIHNKPTASDTTDYRLKTDLAWEEFEVEQPTETDIDAEKALSIILGGAE